MLLTPVKYILKYASLSPLCALFYYAVHCLCVTLTSPSYAGQATAATQRAEADMQHTDWLLSHVFLLCDRLLDLFISRKSVQNLSLLSMWIVSGFLWKSFYRSAVSNNKELKSNCLPSSERYNGTKQWSKISKIWNMKEKREIEWVKKFTQTHTHNYIHKHTELRLPHPGLCRAELKKKKFNELQRKPLPPLPRSVCGCVYDWVSMPACSSAHGAHG